MDDDLSADPSESDEPGTDIFERGGMSTDDTQSYAALSLEDDEQTTQRDLGKARRRESAKRERSRAQRVSANGKRAHAQSASAKRGRSQAQNEPADRKHAQTQGESASHAQPRTRKKHRGRVAVIVIAVVSLLAIGGLANSHTPTHAVESPSTSTSAAASASVKTPTARASTHFAASASTSASKATPSVSASTATSTAATTTSGTLKIHYLDVGQGDSEFLELPDGKTMLIDAGPTDSGAKVVAYIKSLGYTSIDYVVASHPHEDHIGGMPRVLSSFQIGQIFAPKASNDTAAFEAFLDAAAATGIDTATAGKTIFSDGDCSATILSPPEGASYTDLNDWSAIVEVKLGSKNFLFPGDASIQVLKAACSDHIDILKVAHHGSEDSTDGAIVKRLSPSFAVISVGKDNSYGLPDQSTLDALATVSVFRTDQLGTIVATCAGDDITFNVPVPPTATAAAAAAADAAAAGAAGTAAGVAADTGNSSDADAAASDADDNGQMIVYITNTGKKYHLDGCSSLSKSKIAITLDEAKAEGYTPCSKCNPPS